MSEKYTCYLVAWVKFSHTKGLHIETAGFYSEFDTLGCSMRNDAPLLLTSFVSLKDFADARRMAITSAKNRVAFEERASRTAMTVYGRICEKALQSLNA